MLKLKEILQKKCSLFNVKKSIWMYLKKTNQKKQFTF